MRRVLISFLLAAAVFAPVAAVAQESAPAQRIDVIKVEGPIDRPLLGYLEESLDEAVADGAIVVLQLDAPGTLNGDAVALADRIASVPVPVVVWVGAVPARASGAGLLLLYASSFAATAPGAQIGPLEPLDVLHVDEVPEGLDEDIDGWLAERGRRVDRSVEDQALTAQEAVDHGFVDGLDAVATTIPELLNQIDGRTVQTPGGPVTLSTRIVTDPSAAESGTSVELTFVEPGPIVRTQHAVATPSMVYFLLVVALACLAFEITQPGFGFAGFAGIALLALGAYGATVAIPDPLGLVLLLGGIGAMVLDVRLRRLAVLSAMGLAAFVAGSLLVYGDVASAVRISPWLIGGLTVGSILYHGFALTVAIQSRDRIVSTQQGLIGLVGEARGRMAPDGPVYVKGALWRGRSVGEAIDLGARVRVRGVDGLILRVEPEPDAIPDDVQEPLPAND